jgi:hypothetical protein
MENFKINIKGKKLITKHFLSCDIDIDFEIYEKLASIHKIFNLDYN